MDVDVAFGQAGDIGLEWLPTDAPRMVSLLRPFPSALLSAAAK